MELGAIQGGCRFNPGGHLGARKGQGLRTPVQLMAATNTANPCFRGMIDSPTSPRPLSHIATSANFVTQFSTPNTVIPEGNKIWVLGDGVGSGSSTPHAQTPPRVDEISPEQAPDEYSIQFALGSLLEQRGALGVLTLEVSSGMAAPRGRTATSS